jgi:hypothetical protein
MITLHFIKNGSDFDDTVKITRTAPVDDASATFTVTYVYARSHRTKRLHGFSAEQAMTWIQRMIHLVIADDEPFDSVQLTAPMMPVTLFNVGELMENYRVLTDAVQFSLEHWPEEVVDDSSTVTYSESETEEEEEEEEEEYEEVEDHPSPPGGGSEPMMEEDAYVSADRQVSIGAGAVGLSVTLQTRGRHHHFYSSETE